MPGSVRDGAASISGSVDGEQIALVDDVPGASLRPGNLHVRADCVGESLTFYVDGEQGGGAAQSLAHGDVGLIAGGAGQGHTDVRFDNFWARSP